VTLEGETLTVTVTVELGKAAKAAESPALERLAEPWHDSDYGDRRGYDPTFLGIELPLPEPRDPSMLAKLSEGSTVIPYTHFSLAMHAKRRLALFTASNVRDDAATRAPEPGRDYTRGALGGLKDGDTEKWFTDPRLRGIEQLPDVFFTKDRQAFDKGHLVRRDDVAWGETYAELRQANGDTYHVTNCSPQVADFNRPHGRENWGDLEKAVLAQATEQRLSVFAGPVLADDDPVFKGVDDQGAIAVRIPRAYWKVIVAPDGAGLGAYAFVLEQDLSGVAMEKVTFGAEWRRFMLPVKELEERLKLLRFPDALHDADRFATSAGRALAGIAKA
jgi:endonuclease G